MKKCLFLALALGLVLVAGLLLWAAIDEPEPVELLSYGNVVMGAEKHFYSQSEIENLNIGNPWYPGGIVRTLPIYLSSSLDKPGTEQALAAKQALRSLGIWESLQKPDHFQFHYRFSNGSLSARTTGYTISFNEKPFSLPWYLPDDTDGENTFSQLKELGNYLGCKFSIKLGMERPIACFAYSRDGYNNQISTYAGKNSLRDRIVSYHFDRIDYRISEFGSGFHISRISPQWLKKVGDYPIISLDQAQTMLENGVFLHDFLYTFRSAELFPKEPAPSREEVVYTTLLYDTNHYNVTLPFYLFYAPSQFESKNSETLYRVYYVPAIDLSYIENPEIFGPGFEKKP